ncbi:MAG: hypothetical protein ACTSRY_04070 [Alphaproteobacteria bacterium]
MDTADFTVPTGLAESRNLDPLGIEAERVLATTSIGQSATASAPQKTRARDLIRLFLNVSRFAAPTQGAGGFGPSAGLFGEIAGAARTNGGGANRAASANNESVLEAALDAALDKDTIGLIGQIFHPTIEPTGLISISVAGLGNFILLLSEAEGRIRIIDADTGRTVVSYRQGGEDASSGIVNGRISRNFQPVRGSGKGVSLGRFLSEVWTAIVDLATEPLVILAAFLVVIMWVLWTLRARED